VNDVTSELLYTLKFWLMFNSVGANRKYDSTEPLYFFPVSPGIPGEH
jgi:hypothetical protein